MHMKFNENNDSFLFNKSSVFSLPLCLLVWPFIAMTFSDSNRSFDAKRKLALALLSSCMLAIDWVVKQRYWATKANYHLVFFALFVFALLSSNGTIGRPCALFYWVGLNFFWDWPVWWTNQETFNAAFFIFLGACFILQALVFSFGMGYSFFQGGLDLRTFVISSFL